MSQVMHDYGDVCQSITELAVETRAPISAEDFGMLHGCLDSAIAGAVTQYGRDRNQATLDGQAVRENERLGFFTHELKNLLHTALLAFEVVKSGNVGVAGTTGTVLQRSLLGARDLIARALAETRLTQGVQNREPFLVACFIGELAPAGTLAANAHGITLVVPAVGPDLAIEGDRHKSLAGVDMNTAARHAEALLTTGALQSAIFNSANFSSIATDAKGVIQIFNVGAERMLGYAAAEVMNQIAPAGISDPQEVIARAKALSVELSTPITPGFEALVFKASRGIEDIYELTYS